MFSKEERRSKDLGFHLTYGKTNQVPSYYCNETTNIQDYFMDPYDSKFNNEVIKDIEDESNTHFFEPLTFLNLLYRQAKYVLEHSTQKVVKHIDSLIMTMKQRELLYKHLINLMKLDPQILKQTLPKVSFHEEWQITVQRLEYELEVLKSNFKLIEQDFELVDKYDWERISGELQKIESIGEKVVYLTNLKFDYLLDCENADQSLGDFDIVPQCEIELKRLEDLIEIENNHQLMTIEDECDKDSIYNREQLVRIYDNSISQKLIRCSEADFLYCFARIGEMRNKIAWKYFKGGRNNKPNRTALKYYCQKIIPDIKPARINRSFDISVDSNTTITSPFQDIDQVFKNL